MLLFKQVIHLLTSCSAQASQSLRLEKKCSADTHSKSRRELMSFPLESSPSTRWFAVWLFRSSSFKFCFYSCTGKMGSWRCLCLISSRLDKGCRSRSGLCGRTTRETWTLLHTRLASIFLVANFRPCLLWNEDREESIFTVFVYFWFLNRIFPSWILLQQIKI